MIIETKEAFIDLVYNNIEIIYKICNMYAREPERDDLQQEIIYQLWKSFPSFRGEAKFQTWMYRVALNTAMLGMRAWKKNQVEFSEKENNISDGSFEEFELQLQIKQLYHHISKLNDIDKAIIFLHLEQCSYKEISDITGMSEKNISVKLVRIRKKLRAMFDH